MTKDTSKDYEKLPLLFKVCLVVSCLGAVYSLYILVVYNWNFSTVCPSAFPALFITSLSFFVMFVLPNFMLFSNNEEVQKGAISVMVGSACFVGLFLILRLLLVNREVFGFAVMDINFFWLSRKFHFYKPPFPPSLVYFLFGSWCVCIFGIILLVRKLAYMGLDFSYRIAEIVFTLFAIFTGWLFATCGSKGFPVLTDLDLVMGGAFLVNGLGLCFLVLYFSDRRLKKLLSKHQVN